MIFLKNCLFCKLLYYKGKMLFALACDTSKRGKGLVKILSVLGTRPQIIKHWAMSRAWKKSGVKNYTVYTGQHTDYLMNGVFFDEFDLDTPNKCLEVGHNYGLRIGDMVNGVMNCVNGVMDFDFGVVYGDCDTTLAGALAIKKLGIPLVHIEAGIRCFDKGMIEERNRIMVDGVSDYCFCPTITAMNNLFNEGIRRIFAGNLNYDLFKVVKEKLGMAVDGGYTLVTMHRQESLDKIDEMLERIAGYPRVKFLCHPHTRKVIGDRKLSFELLQPVSYMAMHELIRCASTVVTDSGGVQQEAWMWGKPLVNLRDTTEWPETLHTVNLSLFGDGKAAELIVKYLENEVGYGRN